MGAREACACVRGNEASFFQDMADKVEKVDGVCVSAGTIGFLCSV